MQFIHLPVFSPSLSPDIFLTPRNVCSSPNMRAQDYLPCKPLVKLIVLNILILMFLDIKVEDTGFGTEW